MFCSNQKLLLFVFIICIITACNTDDNVDPNNNTNTNNNNNSSTSSVDANKLLDLVNAVRSSGCTCGNTFYPAVDSIAWNSTLEDVATAHSEDMNNNGFFNHTGSDGSNAGERLTAAGYNWSTYGENIAEGYSTEEAVIQGWLNSEFHCANIMDADFKEMGIGRSDSFWTQIFGDSF